MHTHAHSSSYIIRCLHIPKEPLQPQHDLDWQRDKRNSSHSYINLIIHSNTLGTVQVKQRCYVICIYWRIVNFTTGHSFWSLMSCHLLIY